MYRSVLPACTPYTGYVLVPTEVGRIRSPGTRIKDGCEHPNVRSLNSDKRSWPWSRLSSSDHLCHLFSHSSRPCVLPSSESLDAHHNLLWPSSSRFLRLASLPSLPLLTLPFLVLILNSGLRHAVHQEASHGYSCEGKPWSTLVLKAW